MADEITITAKLQASKLSAVVGNTGTAINADMSGDQMYHATPSISTTAGALTLGPVNQSNGYWLFVRNTDATNDVWLSTDGGTTYGIVVAAGKSVLLKVRAGMTLWADAQTAACICEIVAVEE